MQNIQTMSTRKALNDCKFSHILQLKQNLFFSKF
jgi:hypothetical protein